VDFNGRFEGSFSMLRDSRAMSGSTHTGKPASEAVTVVYDGECPFCTNYVKLLRLRDAIGPVRLVDARSNDPVVKRLLDAGYDLDEGMAMVDGETIWHGQDCIHRLALMSTPSGAFNRINAAVFRSPHLSKAIYPMLRGGRNLTLRVMGRKKINAA
jgi:predicted DCC family thiol-disulfide oxidoreductase YuxK